MNLQDDDDEDEIEDWTIKSTDLLIVAARNEDDVSLIEVGHDVHLVAAVRYIVCPL